MKNTYKLSYVLLATIMVVGTVFAFSRNNQTPSKKITQPQPDQAKWKLREEENKKDFPVADFNEPEPAEPLKRELRRQKKLRKNKLGLVSLNPGPNRGGGLFLPHNQFNFPALPVKESSVIVIADVLHSEAHLSEDKTSVFSEFTIRLTDVLKADSSLQSTEMVVERLGGYVRYPDGRKLLYRVGTGSMPRVGARYLFFLKPSPELDYSILTAYEFGQKGVIPLDSSGQFQQYEGYDPAVLRTLIIETINKSGKQ
jgi:hypothetical protein